MKKYTVPQNQRLDTISYIHYKDSDNYEQIYENNEFSYETITALFLPYGIEIELEDIAEDTLNTNINGQVPFWVTTDE